jgi:hypothetical protein
VLLRFRVLRVSQSNFRLNVLIVRPRVLHNVRGGASRRPHFQLIRLRHKVFLLRVVVCTHEMHGVVRAYVLDGGHL